MKIRMKNLYILILVSLFFCSCTKKYKVRVIFCDNRPSKTIIVYDVSPPNNNRIRSYQLAAPTYEANINVCEVYTICEIKE